MELPEVTPVIGDATKVGLAREVPPAPITGETVYQLLPQLLFSDDFVNLANWNVLDSGGNINCAAGIVTINGNGLWNQNGIWRNLGALKPGYIQFDIMGCATNPSIRFGTASAAGLDANAPRSTLCLKECGARSWRMYGLSDNHCGAACKTLTVGWWYTVRGHIIPGPVPAQDRFAWTIEGGGEYPTETRLVESEGGPSWWSYPATLYAQFQRQTNDGANVNCIRQFRHYGGYDMAGQTLTYNHDAGAAYQFVNFDLSALVLPGGLVSPNLMYRWSFDDGAPAWSGWLTLAQLNAAGKQFGYHRYARLDVQLNSDGLTQAYACKPNHASAIDYVRPTPAVPTWGMGEVSGIR